MKLALKLSLVLGAVLSCLLCAVLWLAYRGELRRMQRAQDVALSSAIANIAARCAAAGSADAAADCAAAFRTLDGGGTVRYAAAIDERQRIRQELHPGQGGSFVALASNRPGPWSGAFDAPAPVRVFTQPMISENANVGVIVAAFDQAALESELTGVRSEAKLRLLQACLLGIGAGLLLSLGIVHYFLSPLDSLVEGVRRVATGDFSHRVEDLRSDELGALAKEFNRMATQLSEHEEIRRGFLSQITHDLRNPLHAMLGTMDVLLAGYRGTLAPEQSDSIKTLLDNGRSMSEMVNNIVDIGRLESGKFELRPSSLELADEIESVVELMRASAEKFGVALKTQLLPVPEDVFADPQAFRRVLTNLISNAIKFTPSGGSVTVKTWLGRRKETVISVADTGIGIPQDRLGLLFAKFSQVPETRNKVRESPGAGLGLFICKSLVEAHGGTIWVESVPQKGSVFHCAFPPSPESGSPSP